MVNAKVEAAAHDAEVQNILCRNDQQMEEAFQEIIQKGKDSGEITNPLPARALARFIFNAVKGMQVTAKSAIDKTVFNDIIQLTISVLH